MKSILIIALASLVPVSCGPLAPKDDHKVPAAGQASRGTPKNVPVAQAPVQPANREQAKGSKDLPKPTTGFTFNLQLESVDRLSEGKKVSFADVQPIFERSCVSCHHEAEDFDVKEFPFQSVSWTDMPELVDRMIEKMRDPDPMSRMPYMDDPLPESEIQLIEKWRENGLLADAATGIDDMVDNAVIVVTHGDKVETIALQKAKESGRYTSKHTDFPMFAKSLVVKVFKGEELVNQLRFDNFNVAGNGKFNVRMNLQ